MPSRRQFVQKSAAALAAGAGLSAMNTTPAEAAQTLNYTFLHHVFFWLKNPGSQADKDQLIKALKELGKLDVIKAAHVSTPTKTKFDEKVTDDSYSVSVALFFDNAKDEDTYLHHAQHMKFIKDNSHLWSKVVVYDSLKA